MLIYAEAADLTVAPWSITEPPANVGGFLLEASVLVRRATLSSLYEVDADGYPSVTKTREGFRDATCAQVSMWVAAGIDPTANAAGQSGVVSAKSLGPRSIQFATYERDAERRQYLTTHPSTAALQILADLGLCDSVQVTG